MERDLDAELESFVEILAEEKTRAGVDPDEARRLALLELGGKEMVKEAVRDRWVGEPVRVFLRDTRFGARLLRRSPGFAAIVILTLALGIGATTAVFSVAQSVLFRSLPYPDSERLVSLWTRSNEERKPFSPPDYVELREQVSSFQDLAALQGDGLVTLSLEGERPEPVRARDVSPGFLAAYGVEPYLGREFRPEEDRPVGFEDRGDPNVSLPESPVLISYELFRDRFGAERTIIGRRVEIDEQPSRIVGVTPPGFRTLLPDEDDYSVDADVWTLSHMDFPRMPRDVSFLRVIGRLREGVTLDAARAEAELFARRERALHPLHREGRFEVEVIPLRAALSEGHRAAIGILLGAVGLVLLIACANITNLLLSRSTIRQKELAVRMALGARRSRLIRQLLAESFICSALGAVGGFVLCRILLELFVRWAPSSLPRTNEIRIDGAVLAFTASLTLLSTVLVSIVPALRFSRPKNLAALRSAGRGATDLGPRRWDGLLVIGEVGLSVVLVIGTALLLESLTALLEVKPGFEPKHVLTAEMSLSTRRYPRYPRPDARVRFARRVTERVAEIPSVEAVGLALVVPLSRQDAGHTYATESIAAASRVYPPAKYRPVTPGYFDAVGTRLLAGRDFDWTDVESGRLVTIVDEKLARKAWPGRDPIGQRLRIEHWSTRGGPIGLEPLWTEVVGVVENVRSSALDHDDVETVYLPYDLYAVSELSILVRSRQSPARLTTEVREAVGAVDPDLAVLHFRVMDEWIAESVAPRRFSLMLLSGFGVLGLGLALVGIYGVLSSSVSLSKRELSVRIALGALPRNVLASVLTKGALLTGAGLVLGLAGAGALGRVLSSQLYGIGPTDLRAYGLVSLLTLSAGFAACYFPARRAARLDPMKILRLE